MLGARPTPPLRRPPPPIVPGERAGFSSPATSPSRWKTHDADGVGLGIVAALNKSGEQLSKSSAVVCSPRFCRPISIACAKNLAGGGGWADSDDSECYTCVTCRGGGGQSPVTTVYYGVRPRPRAQFELSPPIPRQEESTAKTGFLAPSFLSHCNLCHKKLHGQDIYMYRGEKAFCSEECRYHQIASDEFKESSRSKASKASDGVTVSAYNHGGYIVPGVVAA